MFSLISLWLGILCLIATIALEINAVKEVKKSGNLFHRIPMKDSAMFTVLFLLLSIALKLQGW